MSLHEFQIGQRVVIANPPADAPELAGLVGLYLDDTRDGRLMVRLYDNGYIYAFAAHRLEHEHALPHPET